MHTLREIKQREAVDERRAADDAARDEEVARWHAADQAEAETAETPA